MQKINILIPMNGLGNRFRDEGYFAPKPLINILGKPMIFWLLDNLDLQEINQVIVPYTTILDNYDFQNQLNSRYKNVNFKFYPINHDTKGAAETVYLGLNNLIEKDLHNNIMVMDCDTFHFSNIIQTYQNSEHKNNIFYFTDKQEFPIYSYIDIDNQNFVKSINEKNKISNNANCGIYCFETGKLLKDYCEKLLSSEKHTEYYISYVYDLMLQDKIKVSSTYVENFNCVGTPMQLKIFCENYNHKKERFCFDLDKTLVTLPVVENDYTSCLPIEKNINFLKHLKNLGHYIIIHTARRMRTHNNNVGAVIKDIGYITQKQLKDFDIPYDELHFGKPYAQYYIDDLAVNCNFNLEKQTGYYNSTIKSRSFNNVEIFETMVIKTGLVDGEQYYYQQIKQHESIKNLFPKLLESKDNKIIIEKINGLNFSYLYTNNALTENQFISLLECLKKIHDIPINDIDKETIIKETKNKILDRYNNFDYSKFYESKLTLDKIIEYINEYEPKSITAIHGDPVFTNIIINKDNEIKLIDMRGKLGNQYTIGGDPMYDLSKIYQSISGYDCILNNTTLNVNEKLLKILSDWIEKNYQFNLQDVKKFAATLYFSLIPLHNNERCYQYYQIAKNLI